MDYSKKWGMTYNPHYDDMDNPFRALPIDDNKTQRLLDNLIDPGYRYIHYPTSMEEADSFENICGLINGLPSNDVPIFLDFARSALFMSRFYGRYDYKEGVLLAYDRLSWDKDNPNVQRMVNFLRQLADLGKPVAFIRWGQDFEAWASREGYLSFGDKVKKGNGDVYVWFAPTIDDC